MKKQCIEVELITDQESNLQRYFDKHHIFKHDVNRVVCFLISTFIFGCK